MKNSPRSTLVEGSFRLGTTTEVHQLDAHTSRSEWMLSEALATNGELRLSIYKPSVHTMYYAADSGRVVWGERKADVVRRCKTVGMPVRRIVEVEGGTTVTFKKNARPVVTKHPEVQPIGKAVNVTIEHAAMKASSLLDKAVSDMLDKSHKHVVCLSGGTDSVLVAAALKRAGADLVAVTVATAMDVFDMEYAVSYAKQLGIPHVPLILPKERSEIKALTSRAILTYEAADLSNTYMTMCNLLIRDWAEENGYQGIWQGYYADRLLGYDLTMKQNYMKAINNAEPDSDSWAEWRNQLYLHTTPNDRQVAKALRGGRTYWRTPYLDYDLRRYVASLCMSVAPYEYKEGKLLFNLMSDKVVNGGSWLTKSKKGYYTGSGLNLVAREHKDILSDEALRATMAKLKLLGAVA